MNNKEIKEEILSQIEELESLLDDRIKELHELSGTVRGQFFQGARHSYCYYRDFVWKIKALLNQLK